MGILCLIQCSNLSYRDIPRHVVKTACVCLVIACIKALRFEGGVY